MAKLKNAARPGSNHIVTTTASPEYSYDQPHRFSRHPPTTHETHPRPETQYLQPICGHQTYTQTTTKHDSGTDAHADSSYYHPDVFNGYSPHDLAWNDLHTLNSESIYCYCGQDRFLDVFMLQCRHCLNWYHEDCVSIRLAPHVLFSANYEFTCAACSPSRIESLARTQPAWKEIVATVLANLMMNEIRRVHLQDMSARALTHASIEPSYFIREDFAQFIESHWSALWGTNKEKVTKVWKGTLSTTLYQYRDVFITTVDTRITQAPFTLFDQNLFNIRPGYLDMFSKTPGHSRLSARILPTLKTATDQVTGGTAGSASSLHSLQQLESVIPGATSATVFIGATSYSLLRNRGARKERGVALPKASVPPGIEVPFNRDGYKYSLAEINPFLRYTAYRECNMVPWRGGHAAASMSREDRSPSITLSNNATSVMTSTGFRTARAMFPMRQGAFYYEVFIEKGGGVGGDALMCEEPYVRVGVAKREASLLGPVGYDDTGFAYRDKTGDRVTNSRPTAYGESYGAGDTIGTLLVLPPWAAIDHTMPFRHQTHLAVMRDRTPIRFKTSVYLETKDYLPLRDHPLPPVPMSAFPQMPSIPGSKLVFFKNGQCQGIAFQDLPAPVRHVCARINEQMASYDDGSLGYYPAISCYRGGKVTVNFGPHFMFPLPESWNPVRDGLASLPLQIQRTFILGRSGPVPRAAGTKQEPESRLLEEAMDVDPSPRTVQAEPDRSEFTRSTRASRAAEDSDSSPPEDPCLPMPTTAVLDPVYAQTQYPVPQSVFLQVDRAWKSYAEAQWDHDTEECLWDMVDEIDHWHALEVQGLDRCNLSHPAPIILDREDEPSLRPIPNLVFPSRTETYAEHMASSAARDQASVDGAGNSGMSTGLTLRQLLMPAHPHAPPSAKRARIKWALTEEP